MSERVTLRLHITGRVQGVWFRESMRQEAQSLGIAGWVRNRMDGSVESVVQGTPDAVEKMIAWAKRGPRDARVDRVEISDEPAETFATFEKRHTA
jgi:acylphosphatase